MKIFFVNGIRGGDEVEFAIPEITIGREDDNVLRIPTAGVSRYHARIYRNTAGEWLVGDQGSTNGVKLNRSRIVSDTVLREGDLIEIGDQMIRVTELAAAPPKVIFNPIPRPATPTPPGLNPELRPGVAPGTGVERPSGSAAVPSPPPAPPRGEAAPGRSSGETSEHAAPPPFASGGRPQERRARKPRNDDDDDGFDDLSAMLRKGGSIFSGRGGARSDGGESAGADGPGRRRSNFFFYAILAALAVCALAFISLMMAPGKTEPAAEETASRAGSPLNLFYEKEIISRDNIFRFSMLLENESVTFTVDDLKSQRHVLRKFDAVGAGVDILRNRLRSSGVWSVRPVSATPGPELPRLRRRLLIAEAPQLVDLTFHGKYVPDAFAAADQVIREFAENYGLETIALTPEQLRSQAESSFIKAEELFENREAKLSNLRDSIVRYRQVVDYLGQFRPPPQLWDRAKQRLAEAEELRRKKLEYLDFEQVRLRGLRDFAQLRQVYLQIMELADKESREYDLARQRLFIIDSVGKKNK